MCIVVLSKNVIGKYYDTNSLIHNMNPIIKIICLFIFIILSFFSFNFYFNLFIFILIILLILLSNVPFNYYFNSIYNVKFLLLFIFVINILFNNGFYVAFILVMRIIFTLLYSMLILYTTKIDEIIFGLQCFFSPLKFFKIPVNKMAFSIGLALKFMPELILSFNKVLKGYYNKGIYLENLNFKNKIDLIKNMIISVFIVSIKKADMLADVMEIRLYDVDNYKINFSFIIHILDIFILLIHVMLLLLVIRIEVFL